MKLRIANKIIIRALNTGDEPRGSTFLRAMKAFPQGARNHPRKYWAAGLTVAFLRRGHSINSIRFGIDAKNTLERIEAST
jgi:hypothetical protein